MFSLFIDTIKDLAAQSGLAVLGWQNVVMILISFVFISLAIRQKFEPLLLLPIAFGMLLTNLPNTGLYHPELWNIDAGHELNFGDILHNGGLLDMLYLGVKLQIYPALIFLGIGCMTDFAPLIANPKSFLLGAAAQAGIFLITLLLLLNFLSVCPRPVPSVSSAVRTVLLPFTYPAFC